MKVLSQIFDKNLNSSTQIKLGALMSYAAIAFNTLSGLLYTPWMVRQIGQSEFGLYTLAISLISFFAMDFGLGSAVSRFLSQYKAKNDTQGEKRFLGITFKIFSIITATVLLALIVVFILIGNIYVELTALELQKLKVIYIIAGLFTVISFPFKPFDGILIANERFIFIKFIDLFHRVVTVTLLVIALSLGYGLYSIVLVNATVGLGKIALKYNYIRKKTDTNVELNYRNSSLYLEIFKFSAWTTIIVVAQRFILNITPTILAAFAGSKEIAVFSIGMTIEGYTWTIALALGGLFLPRVTKLLNTNGSDMSEFEILLIKVGRVQFLIVGLIIAGFTSMGYEFMILWMGRNFINSYYVALLLIWPSIISLTQEIANTALIAKNEIRYRAVISITIAFMSTALSVIMSPKFGAIGAAVSIFIANIIGHVIIMNIVYYKVLKINIFRFLRACHLKMLFPFLFTILLGFIVQYLFPTQSLLIFMFKVIFITTVYCLLMWRFSMNQYEKSLIYSLLRKIKKR